MVVPPNSDEGSLLEPPILILSFQVVKYPMFFVWFINGSVFWGTLYVKTMVGVNISVYLNILHTWIKVKRNKKLTEKYLSYGTLNPVHKSHYIHHDRSK